MLEVEVPKRIVIIGTLDTKGEEIKYIKERIEGRGHQTIVIDTGILGEAFFEPTITRQQVAQASGTTLEEIIAFNDEAKATAAIAEGVSKLVKELYSSGKLDGAISIGGTVGTSLALTAMNSLPIGVPKVILSTIAFSPLITPDLVSADLMMIQWAAGLWGLNTICQKVLDETIGAICGAVEAQSRKRISNKSMVGITSLGMSACRYLYRLKPALEDMGYEVVAFHTMGMGGRAFEQAIADGSISAALDLATNELIELVSGGVCDAGKHRLEAAGKRGIPQIIAPGCIDFLSWPANRPLLPQFKEHAKGRYHSLIIGLNTTKEEKARVGELIADKLKRAKGPAAVLLPMRGFSEFDRPGSPFYDPEGREAFCQALKNNIKPEVKVVELDAHINDAAFADEVIALFNQIV